MITKDEAIQQEIMKYVRACRRHDTRAAHIHRMTIARLRGWIVEANRDGYVRWF